jgi:succinate dehydrogenase flavin-adding protein (antitoxin of CptAB toxin-antitoxin module)
MSLVGFGKWLRRLFSSTGVDDEAAEREDYGVPDRGRGELERDRFGSFAEREGTQAAEDELEEFEPPRDQAP